MSTTYIIQIKRGLTITGTRESGRRAYRDATIRSSKSKLSDRLKGLWARLEKAGVVVHLEAGSENSFVAEGGLRFQLLPHLGIIAAKIPAKLVEHFRNDPDVSSVTEDRKLPLRPCER